MYWQSSRVRAPVTLTAWCWRIWTRMERIVRICMCMQICELGRMLLLVYDAPACGLQMIQIIFFSG